MQESRHVEWKAQILSFIFYQTLVPPPNPPNPTKKKIHPTNNKLFQGVLSIVVRTKKQMI